MADYVRQLRINCNHENPVERVRAVTLWLAENRENLQGQLLKVELEESDGIRKRLYCIYQRKSKSNILVCCGFAKTEALEVVTLRLIQTIPLDDVVEVLNLWHSKIP